MENDTVNDLGALIGKLDGLTIIKKDLELQLKQISEEIKEYEWKIIHALQENNVEKASVGGTSVEVKPHTYPKVEDWEKVYDFIKQDDALFLLERRVSVTSYRSYLALGRTVPGIVPNNVIKLSVHKSYR